MQSISPSLAPRPLKIVFLGDSLTQGTEDGDTVATRQVHGYAEQVSQALGAAPNAAYITGEGIPYNPFLGGELNPARISQKDSDLQNALTPLIVSNWQSGPPAVVDPLWLKAGEGQRDPASLDRRHHRQNDFAVPGFKARHLLTIHSEKDMLQEVHDGLMTQDAVANEVPLTRAVLQNGTAVSNGSEIDQAVRARPDIAVVWAGANDTLHALADGYIDDATLTPLHDQRYTFRVTDPLTNQTLTRTTGVLPGYESIWLGRHGIMDRLLHDTKADIFLMTIPQSSVTPTLIPLGQKIGPLPYTVKLPDGTDVTAALENWAPPTGVKGPGVGGRTQFPPGSRIDLFSALKGFLTSGLVNTAADFHKVLRNPPAALFTEDDVADPAEQAIVSERVDQFNAVLAKAAKLSPRVHLMDTNAMFADINAHGHALVGQGPAVEVTGTFTGVQRDGKEGIFSYDGLHPSDTGYAIVANALVAQMQHDLKGNPRFVAVQNAKPIDEKAVFAQDPHHLHRV